MVFFLKNKEFLKNKYINNKFLNKYSDEFEGLNKNSFSDFQDILSNNYSQDSQNIKNIQNHFGTQLICFLMGFFLSISKICGQPSPLGISVCAATNSFFFLTTSIGSLLGYLISDGNNIVYITSVFLIITMRWVFENKKNICASPITFWTFLGSSIIFLVTTNNISIYNILLILCEAIMATGAAFFFSHAKTILDNKVSYKGLSSNELTVLIVSFLIILVPVMSITVYSISLGKILAIYAILFFALNIEASNSAVIGIFIGLAVLLNTEYTNSYIIMSYGLGSFFASLSKKHKALAVTSVFFVIHGAVLMFSNFFDNRSFYSSFFELLLSCLLFLTTSHLFSSKISLTNQSEIENLNCENVKNLMLLKLSFAANTLHDIAMTTQQVSKKLSQNSSPTIEKIYHQCASQICNKCNLKMFCWNTAYNDIVDSFNNMTPILRQNGKITSQDVSVFMKQKCKNLEEILANINQNYHKFIAQKGVNRKVAEIREVVTDQFDGMAMMLQDFAKEFHEINQFDKKTSIKAKKILSNMGLKVSAITSFVDKYGRLTIEARSNSIKDTDLIGKTIALQLSDACQRNFGAPSFVKLSSNMKLTITEKPNYQIDFGVTQLSCGNLKDCGDSYNYFVDSKSKAYLILSDGMGTGRRAAIDGNIAAGLLSKLIKSGLEFESALKVVNSALLVKSGDESLATIDVTSIDLYTGYANMFKVGAAPTFTRKSGRVVETSCSSLPAGIFRGVSFDKKTLVLKDKDIVVMVSDGVTNNDYSWIYDEIKLFKYNLDAKELSRKIALESKLRNQSNHDDDVTVLVGIISKGV